MGGEQRRVAPTPAPAAASTSAPRGSRRRGRLLLVAVAVVVASAVVAACAAPAGGPVTTTSAVTPTTAPGGDDAFTVVFIGDSEPRMRGNTNEELSAYVQNLISYTTTKEVYFDHGGGDRYRIDPELVILGGDISADRDTSVDADLPIWLPLYQAGIGFLAGFGNHDWEPKDWSDGPGYSVAGHLANESTTAFTRETYRRTAALGGDFSYSEVFPTSAHGPVTFHARYRGVEIANFNTFLYQPSYHYPEGWPLSCNLLGGGAGCETFVSAEPQITAMQQRLSPDPATPVLFVQHYPLTTDDGWWSDYDASGTTVTQKKDRLLGLMADHDRSVLLAGHNHGASHHTHDHLGRTLDEYVAPYFGGADGVDLTRGGGFVALLVSPTRGILEVRTVPGGI